jgi:hypothetical protein
MLLEDFDKQHLTFIMNVLGPTGNPAIWAYRGDLVLIEGALREGSATDRKPPELLLKQAAILADDTQFFYVNGLFDELKDVAVFIEKYGRHLSPATVTLLYVENIAAAMQVELNGVVFRFLPYKSGMVWNETLEQLYIEKADLKGQSAEDKVMVAYNAAKSYKFKGESLPFETALTKTIVVKKEAAVGPI